MNSLVYAIDLLRRSINILRNNWWKSNVSFWMLIGVGNAHRAAVVMDLDNV